MQKAKKTCMFRILKIATDENIAQEQYGKELKEKH